MKAKITYKMSYGPNPFQAGTNRPVLDAWILWRITTPEIGITHSSEPVAIFNYNSEAEMFMAQAHLMAPGFVEIPTDLKELFVRQRARNTETG